MSKTNLKPLFQDEAWSTLAQMSAGGALALPSSLIFVGPEGVGKKRAARALFQALHCERASDFTPCGECVSCQSIANGNHVDIVEVAPKGQQILVDDLRETLKANAYRPYSGAIRMVIIDEAHRLNASAANALLKSLEEPPPYVKFILVTHERARLLPTIISRCQFVNFRALDAEAVAQVATEAGIELSPEIKQVALELSGGGVGKLAHFSEARTLEWIQKTRRWIDAESHSWNEITRFADELAGLTEEQWSAVLSSAVLTARNHALEAAHQGHSQEAYAWASSAFAYTDLAKSLERNANRKLVALQFSQL